MSAPREIPAADLEFACDLLKKETGIVLGDARHYLVGARLRGLVAHEGCADVSALLAAARERGSDRLRRAIVEALTTNETYFFRDEPVWRFLRTNVVPALVRQRSKARALDVWCAACSTGQEPYSLAILLAESFPALRDWRVRILASDVDESVLARARAGLYDPFEVNRGLPGDLRARHFERCGTRWRASSALRDRIEVRKVNLIGSWRDLGRMDLVLLRNVLIYFDQATRRAVLERVARVLAPDGYLVLGSSELCHPLGGLFRAVERGCATFAPAEAQRGAA
jgi:chemotaxis protein methyltransferase CheR